ncbi:hypothetical protein BDK92_1722 [Micromonospora pisi]|uniref:Uncharacterized protein n=1 Tax=Micromonospora pisi TaxID=589240 RepID=A0A495JEL0_9ACTN|nr:multiple cyclophane-containing RiPP AmcA [Micromonospora pisi]RKR87446.1 hypothetical protein BDK92_1722 [Micromonospora pisi]
MASPLVTLVSADADYLERFGVDLTQPTLVAVDAARFDNRPTWDNKPKFDSKPGWDNWSKKGK